MSHDPAAAWHDRAEALADWSLRFDFVRTDRYGAYYFKDGEKRTTTKPSGGPEDGAELLVAELSEVLIIELIPHPPTFRIAEGTLRRLGARPANSLTLLILSDHPVVEWSLDRSTLVSGYRGKLFLSLHAQAPEHLLEEVWPPLPLLQLLFHLLKHLALLRSE